MALLSVFNNLIRKDLQRCGAESKTAEVKGSVIHYYEAPGRADLPPTLLIHGFGNSANTWYQTLIPLAKKLGRVLAIDYPGMGFSKLPAGRNHLSLSELIDTLEAFAREVMGVPGFIVGHSLGGAITLRLLSRQAEDRTKPHFCLAATALAPAGAKMNAAEWQELRGLFDVPDRAAARTLLARVFSASPWPLWLVENDMRAVWRSPPTRKLMDSMQSEDFLTPKELSHIDVPLLLLWGTDERLLPPSLLEYYRQYLPKNATIEVMRGWGHAVQMEKPQELVERVVESSSCSRARRPKRPRGDSESPKLAGVI